MKPPSVRTALLAAAIVALGAFVLLRIGGADAQSSCTHPISASGDYSGSWTSDCLSENTPTEPTNPPSGTRYAHFYTFTLSEDADITIDLTSDTDTYLYLMQGIGTNGAVLHENDDVVSGNTNSRIQAGLQPGDYTIEATTYSLETTGDFTLTVQGLPDASTSSVTPTSGVASTPTTTPTPYPGQGTPTVTPTPTQPSTPADVLTRLTALETVVATQQELLSTLDSKITALDSRMAELEADAVTLTPTPTPEPTGTPEPTPEPTPGLPTSASCSDFSPNANLSRCNLTGQDLSGLALSGVTFTDAILVDADLSNTTLTGADFVGADLSGADLSGADARHAKFKDANLDRAIVVGTQFRSGTSGDDASMFRGAKLTNIAFDTGLNLNGIGFINADVSGSHFIGVDLSNSDLRNATVTGTDFSDADLSEANLKNVSLNRATISTKTDFEEADLSKTDVSEMNITRGNFEGADFEGADLSDSTFDRCDFKDADFKNADLSNAEFLDTDLDDADFDGADLEDTEFDDGSDLQGAKNMDKADNVHDAEFKDCTCPDGTKNDCYPNNLIPTS